MLRSRSLAPLSSILLLACASLPLAAADGLSAELAFARLEKLTGNWQGMRAEESGHGTGPIETTHELRLATGSSVVMEVMGKGSEDEMINMYHLDGEDLLLTHYCSAGNQPRMRLDRQRSTPDRLLFSFVDGTNLEPSRDHYIHDVELLLAPDGTLLSRWTSYHDGKPAGVAEFHLRREN
jgi:hypothetical protein